MLRVRLFYRRIVFQLQGCVRQISRHAKGKRRYNDTLNDPELLACRRRALELAQGLAPTPKHLQSVAREVGSEMAAWAFTQQELRALGMRKFARGEAMLFTREALEQATHEAVARYHASRFPSGARVADLTCGIGGDLIALATRGPAIGFEIDFERAELARWNLAAHNLSADIRELDTLETPWDFDYAFADPARRIEGRRTLTPEAFQPDPHTLIPRLSALRLAGLKLSPLLPDPWLEGFGGGLEFLSFGGECREAVLWLGREAEPGRVAVHIETGERLSPADLPVSTALPADIFYEADPAAIRAHALGTLCERGGLQPLGESNGYLTGPGDPTASPWLRAWRVLAAAEDWKAAATALRTHGAGRLAVKTRGVPIRVEEAQKRFRPMGDRALTLAIYPVQGRPRYAILEGPL